MQPEIKKGDDKNFFLQILNMQIRKFQLMQIVLKLKASPRQQLAAVLLSFLQHTHQNK